MNQSKDLSKRQMRRQEIRRREMRGRLIGIGLITLGALLVAFLIIWPNVKPVAGIVKAAPNPRPQADGNHMGDPNAPVKIVEFSDYQCPYCKQFFERTEPLLVTTYVSTGKVYFTYRSAGNWVSSHSSTASTESEDAAMAVYCGGDQNMFWQMHDMVFSNNQDIEDGGSFTDRRLASIAEAAGLDMTQFNACYTSQKFKSQVDQDGRDAASAGVQGTPSFVMTYTDASGKEVSELIEGAQPFNIFQQKIDAALAAAGQ